MNWKYRLRSFNEQGWWIAAAIQGEGWEYAEN